MRFSIRWVHVNSYSPFRFVSTSSIHWLAEFRLAFLRCFFFFFCCARFNLWKCSIFESKSASLTKTWFKFGQNCHTWFDLLWVLKCHLNGFSTCCSDISAILSRDRYVYFFSLKNMLLDFEWHHTLIDKTNLKTFFLKPNQFYCIFHSKIINILPIYSARKLLSTFDKRCL